jgi:hypothetical protein
MLKISSPEAVAPFFFLYKLRSFLQTILRIKRHSGQNVGGGTLIFA